MYLHPFFQFVVVGGWRERGKKVSTGWGNQLRRILKTLVRSTHFTTWVPSISRRQVYKEFICHCHTP